MTQDHLRKMQAGRKAAAKQREREGIEHVKAFVAYLRKSRRRDDGTWPKVTMPRIPTDAEWEMARARGVVR